MGGLKRLSGDELVAVFGSAGFVGRSQTGTHVKLHHITADERQLLTIPRQGEIDAATLRAVLRCVGRFLPDAWLRARFYDQ